MNIENLVREKIIGNIKIGCKGENGLPKKLAYFNVENDKATSNDVVDIFKQLYPGKPTSLKIMFTNENPFSFRYKRYVNNKAVCIGNDTKAITIGKDSKGRSAQVEIECNENCQQRLEKKCKLVGSLKFKLVGIEADGLWKINTSGGFSLSNIASEIVKYKKAGKSIVGVPFELTLEAQESLAYGLYYSLVLNGEDLKPQLTGEIKGGKIEQQVSSQKEVKQLDEGAKEEKKVSKKGKNSEKEDTKNNTEQVEAVEQENKEETKEDYSNYLTICKIMPTMINNQKFDKIIFQDINAQEVEYVLHPKADQQIIECGIGSVIEKINTKMEAERNILCTYKIIKKITPEGEIIENNDELKKAV